MLGVRPIKMNIQNALCEQAPNSILYIQFCMAERLPQKLKFQNPHFEEAILQHRRFHYYQ